MERARAVVVRAADGILPPGPPTPGMDRRQLLEHEDRWLGWVRTDAGLAGGWHHHGDRDSYVFVLRGGVRIEFGPGGAEHVTAAAGDLIFNPAGLVHREVTETDEPAEFFVVRIGPGPLNVNVEGPDTEVG
ncbi:MAG: cupin domain-containing protein [Candidatus Limnocylindria bacterium]